MNYHTNLGVWLRLIVRIPTQTSSFARNQPRLSLRISSAWTLPWSRSYRSVRVFFITCNAAYRQTTAFVSTHLIAYAWILLLLLFVLISNFNCFDWMPVALKLYYASRTKRKRSSNKKQLGLNASGCAAAAATFSFQSCIMHAVLMNFRATML